MSTPKAQRLFDTGKWPAGQEPVDCLRRVQYAAPGIERSNDLEALVYLVKSGELRDYAFEPNLYGALFGLLSVALTWRAKDTQADVRAVEEVFIGATRVPEFDPSVASGYADENLVRLAIGRADGQATQEEWPHIRDLLLWLYGFCPSLRPALRAQVGKALKNATTFMHKSLPVGPLLEFLVPIIEGFGQELTQVHRSLFSEIFMPLHKTNEWQQWDRQSAMLGMYHKELVRCLLLFLEKHPSLAPRALDGLCAYFPPAREANTPKEVLLIYEIAQVLKYVDNDMFSQGFPSLMRQMTRLLSSHNSQTVQAILQFWKEDHVVGLFAAHSGQMIPTLLPVLLRNGEPHWNPTVNKMTSLVLEKMEASDAACFKQTAEDMWGPGRSRPAYLIAQEAEAAAKVAAEKEKEEADKPADGKPAPNVSSLKFCLGGWKPPASSGGGSSGAPPLTATGVAPWAMGGGGGGGGRVGGGSAGGKQPPVTATGVAPWAFKAGGPPRPGPLSNMQGGGAPLPAGAPVPRKPPGPASGSLGALREDTQEVPAQEASGLDRVHEYMKILCPVEAPTGEEQHWESALTAETPTLLPSLKFHQLVFGADDIASGAFSVVRYARNIVKDKTRSQWPECAVKVIDTKTIQEHGYEASVNREICVLKMLSHPGIARMVSAFRWRDGAYLVLEWASRGDLHTILVQQGKLPEDTTRFFLGETIAALTAIHEAGFVYGDLKPENIVITSTCHAKLADFGGCRPVTAEARQRTQQSLLRRLRDGDWRAKDEPEEEKEECSEADVVAVVDDGRFEGTTMYLPPEVVRGKAPTIAADAWALGCLAYQLITGKPPIWVDSENEDDLRSHIVSFRFNDGQHCLDVLPELARNLTARLMQPDVEQRLHVEAAGTDPFFAGMDVFRLYAKPRGPEVAAAKKATASSGDARWQKRQFSKIWTVTPSPEDYQLPALGQAGGRGSTGTAVAADFKETSLEANSPFLDDVYIEGVVVARSSTIESL